MNNNNARSSQTDGKKKKEKKEEEEKEKIKKGQFCLLISETKRICVFFYTS